MPERAKFLLNAMLALATLFLTSVLWRYPVALIALLIVTGATIFAIRPNRTTVVVYVTAFVLGPAAEAVSIHTGAWEYASDKLLGVPVWLPFVWGNAGLFILNMSELWKSVLAPRTSRPTTADRVAVDGQAPRTDQPPHGDEAAVRSREPASSV